MKETKQTTRRAMPPSLLLLSLKALVAVVAGGDGGRSALEGEWGGGCK